ncbi:hypothetical protein MBRA1_003721 [Malassezia brasiliensis]|uniref:Major facilitator superfamily (MFS) profile domain-containing protein n=1 Tax=Malassezia brasiliensis TaxID=1821822 RepID=A0AAF0DWE8_9BASI|nr:hypothetical protein MBRA1_003721 [Malassezia brasiliensis]
MSASRSETPESVSTAGGDKPFYDAPQAPAGDLSSLPSDSTVVVGSAPTVRTGPTTGAPPITSLSLSGSVPAAGFATAGGAPGASVQPPSAAYAPERGSVPSQLGAAGAKPAAGLGGGAVPVPNSDVAPGAVRGGPNDAKAAGPGVVDDDSDRTAQPEAGATADKDVEKQADGAEALAAVAPAPAPAEPEVDEKGHILVRWDGYKDPEHAINLPFAYRMYLTALGSLMTLTTAFASSSPSFLIPQIMREFNTTEEVVKASTFLFVGGFCFAPLVWAPLAERYGHKWTFVASMTGFTAFNLGCAFAPNIAALIVFRLLAGAFGSCPMSNVAPMVAGLYSIRYLIVSIAMFAVAPMAGPCLGPIVGGYIEQAHAHWRWIFRVTSCMSGFFIFAVTFTMVETLDAIRLKHKAARLRRETGDDRYVAPFEVRERQSPLELVSLIVGKPVRLFFAEPMLIAVTLYISFVYGTLYLLFDAYPVVFGELHHMQAGSVGLTFLGYFVGTVLSALWAIFYDNKRYIRKMMENGGRPPPPEARLHMASIGAPLLVISLFWFAWTSWPAVSYWAPLVAGGVFGMAQFLIFLGLMVYITEVYLFSAASAIAANTVVRSGFGVGFPMFGSQMYHKLDPRWASTLLGFIALLLLPMPFVLTRYGRTLRGMSRHAHTLDH